jgi:outer membrane protein
MFSKGSVLSAAAVLFLCAVFVLTASCEPESSGQAPGKKNLQAEETMEITLGDAIIMALRNNRALKVEQLTPSIIETYRNQENAVFDPAVSAEISVSHKKSTESADATDGAADISVGISKFFPSGTQMFTGLISGRDWSDLYSDRYSARLGITVTQALLQGAGSEFNLASVRQAELDVLSSQFELQGFTEALVAEVEITYWNYALASRQIEIYRQSVQLAERQLKETEEKIDVGILAEIELAAARAEVALRREALINAQSALDSTRLRLLRLLNPEADDMWKYEVFLKNMPAVPEAEFDDVSSHVAVALYMRPDLNQAKLNLQKGEIEISRTKNGLLPRMDLFINLGKTGYADSFGGSVQDIDGESYDISAGIAFEWPLGNRDARARHQRAVFSHQQAEESLENLCQLAELDVRLAYIEVNRNLQQIEATAATKKLQEEKLRAETEKFLVGRSTSLLVAQTQRDLVNSQISEIQAVVNYLKSIVELFRLEGSLLERRGISTVPAVGKQ